MANNFKERTEKKIAAWVNTAIDVSTTTEELWKTFKDLLLSIAKETCGIKIVGEHKKRKSWWNVSTMERVKKKQN